MVAKSVRGHEPTTSRLVGIFTLFFRGKIIDKRSKKVEGKAGSKVKSAVKNRISEILLS